MDASEMTTTIETKASRRTKLLAFLEEHPLCIYCGGETPATTRDHVPSRQLFHRKQWPEGYEFPACGHCNHVTRDAEQVMALISRIYPDNDTQSAREEFVSILRAIRNNYPKVLSEIAPSRDQIAKFNTAEWSRKFRSVDGHAPVVSLAGPLVTACAKAFARKLFCALHYKEFGKIIPPAGGIGWRWYSNVQRLNNELPDDLINAMDRQSLTKRVNRDLSDQFSYLFVRPDDGEITAYFATFRLSFAMLGFVETDASRLELPNEDRLLRPLAPRPSGHRE